MPVRNSGRHEHRAQHQHDRDQRRRHLVHRACAPPRAATGHARGCARHSRPRRWRRRRRCRSPAPARTSTGCSANSRGRRAPRSVPISETGMATTGITAARQLCRKTRMTSTTSSIASSRVFCTASIDSLMNSVGFQMIRYSSPLGKLLDASSMSSALTACGGGERVGPGPLGDAEDARVGCPTDRR